MKRAISVLLSCVLLAPLAAADELRLKDGTKITGNIVGFEGGSFKVETSFGYALVRKDKVASVIVSEWKGEGKAEAPAPAKKESAAPAAKTAEPTATPSPAAAPQPAQSNPAITSAQPPKAPPEPAIREDVQGAYYTNHTYGFRMFKPPSWQVIPDARRALPTAVAALGTDDERTLLIVGREPLRGTVETHVAQTERRLREIYENYRPAGERRTDVAGLPAIERRFRGLVGEKDWSATLLTFARGNELFTVLGMTTSDSELIQIQENVIARTIASLEFVK